MGDKEFENVPSIKSKALRINLNENIYGTFAEIGAGQETVRNFFRAGAASGTIAKTMRKFGLLLNVGVNIRIPNLFNPCDLPYL